jgi:regulator of protease activity HflC (stomatin/prohibitin superfamily)
VVDGGFVGFQYLPLLAFAALLVFAFLAMSVRVVSEYERAVVFRLGRLLGVKGPGLFLLIPYLDSMVKVDLRIMAVDVPEQRIITKDNVTVGVDAVIYFKVVDPAKTVVRIEDYRRAVLMYGQTVLRDVVGQLELDDLLTRREEVNKRLQELLDQVTDAWGVKVTAVTLKEVKLPEDMLRAMAKQAEAERWRRARIIEAEGEKQAAAIMAEAAMIYEKHPVAVRLRELQTLIEIAREKNLVVVTPTTLGSNEVIGAVAGMLGARVQPRGEEGTGGG